MKKFLQIIGVATMLAMSFATQAAQVVTTIAANTETNHSILTNKVSILQVTIANNTTSNITVRLIDAPSTSSVYTNAAHGGVISYITNYVTVYTNFTGYISTNTNTALFTTTNLIAARTNVGYASLVSITVPASNTVVYTPETAITVSFGILATNTPSASATITTLYTN